MHPEITHGARVACHIGLNVPLTESSAVAGNEWCVPYPREIHRPTWLDISTHVRPCPLFNYRPNMTAFTHIYGYMSDVFLKLFLFYLLLAVSPRHACGWNKKSIHDHRQYRKHQYTI